MLGIVNDLDDGFLVSFVFALLLFVVCGDTFGIVIRNESRVSKLIGKWFGSSDEVVEVLEFSANSLNEESSASLAFCLCLWRWDQWFDRIVLRLGVKYPVRWRVRVILPVWVSVVTECFELLMCPIHWVGMWSFMRLLHGF